MAIKEEEDLSGKMKIEIKLDRTYYKAKQSKAAETCDIDAEEFTKAVQDLGMEIIDAGMEFVPDDNEMKEKRCSKYNLSTATKRALCSIFNRREKSAKIALPNVRISLDDFPPVPDHPITA